MKDKACEYPRVKIRRDIEAWRMLQEEATAYGKTPGEFISDLAIAWTRMRAGVWNPYWPLPVAMLPTSEGAGFLPQDRTGSPEEERRRREEHEREQRERKEARLAAARAELLE